MINTFFYYHSYQQKYTPAGCQALTSNVYDKHLPAGKNWVADPYHYSTYVLRKHAGKAIN